jgi:hypothetical protein
VLYRDNFCLALADDTRAAGGVGGPRFDHDLINVDLCRHAWHAKSSADFLAESDMQSFALAVILLFGFVSQALAQHPICGSVPAELTQKKEDSEALKGNLEGKAKLLSGFVGRAELGGMIEQQRRSIYQDADATAAALRDRYLAYMFCVLIMDDKTMPTAEKLKAIKEFDKPAPLQKTSGASNAAAAAAEPPGPKRDVKQVLLDVHDIFIEPEGGGPTLNVQIQVDYRNGNLNGRAWWRNRQGVATDCGQFLSGRAAGDRFHFSAGACTGSFVYDGEEFSGTVQVAHQGKFKAQFRTE